MTNEPAFPNQVRYYDPKTDSYVDSTGMTLRDYFASQALAGMLPSGDPQGRSAFTEMTANELAEGAYIIADAMLKAREQSK
jgi:hypothetical protein